MSPKVQESILEFVDLLIKPIDPNLTVNIQKESNQYRVCINSELEEKIIGEECQLLKSLQHLIRVLIHCKNPDDKTHFILDVNNYKKDREKKIKVFIPEIAKNKVLEDGKTIIITKLSSYERMLIYKILSEVKGISTSSVGEPENRKMLIMPNSEFGSSGMDQAIIININSFKESDMQNF
jgi:spoIIIJ-associated protein